MSFRLRFRFRIGFENIGRCRLASVSRVLLTCSTHDPHPDKQHCPPRLVGPTVDADRVPFHDDNSRKLSTLLQFENQGLSQCKCVPTRDSNNSTLPRSVDRTEVSWPVVLVSVWSQLRIGISSMLNAHLQIDPQQTYAHNPPSLRHTMLSRLLIIFNMFHVALPRFKTRPHSRPCLYSSCNCATTFTRLRFGIRVLFSPLFEVMVHTHVPGGFFGAME